jgi:ATP-dependent helicase/nuclease subunit A
MSEGLQTSSRKWTESQSEAFTEADRSLLVSAAAGSGKTAVLAQRCVHLVCDAKPPCDVTRLLVVTFTDSAAAEMKSRIKSALRQRYAQNPSDRLKRQIDLVEHARISTVHSFCATVLRQNFHLIGLDPNFRILDGDDARLLRIETAADLLERRYESDDTGDFSRLVDAFAQGDDEKLIEKIIHTYSLLCSLSAPRQWIDRTLAEIAEAAAAPIDKSALGQRFIDLVNQTLSDLIRQCSDAASSVRTRGKPLLPYGAQLDELRATVEHWKKVLNSDGLDMLVSEYRDFTLPKAPTIPNSVEGKNGAKALLDSVKKEIKENNLADLLMLGAQTWQAGMAEVLPHARTFLSLVSDFKTDYDAAKADQRALDFSDLERYTLQVLGSPTPSGWKPTPVARALHDQFQHVLVDEYQDINDIQDAILSLVSRECVAGPKTPGNLFCVGDVKQSIFRFRLSDPQLFLDRQERFSKPNAPGKVIYLSENFRSRAPLLSAINAVFGRLMTKQAVQVEYDTSQELKAGSKFPNTSGPPTFPGAPIEFHLITEDSGSTDSDEDPEASDLTRSDYEAIVVAKRIREMLGHSGKPRMTVMQPNDSGELHPRHIEYSDIVILLRAMKFKADAFADTLRKFAIPVHSEGGSGFFASAEVRDILSLLRILDNQRQDIPLAAFLRSPLADLPDPDECLARIRLAYRDEAEQIPFHQAVIRYSKEQTDEWAAHLRWFFSRLEEWRDQANKRPAAELIWSIYQETGYLAYVSGLEDGRQRVANLLELHDRAAQFSHFLRQGLGRFLRFLESLRQEQDLQRPSPAADSQNVVRILSIHRAKGLEFPVVFLPDLGKKHNLMDAQGMILSDRIAGLGMHVVDLERLNSHASLSSALVSSSLYRQTIAEEMRLLYVAMTRAKEHLVCVGSCRASAIEQWTNLWSTHTGPLPADEILAARTPLEWLGPVWKMTAASSSPVFDVKTVELAGLDHDKKSAGDDTAQQSMIDLKPLPTPPAPNDIASAVIDRFSRSYGFPDAVSRPAAQSVTSIAKSAPQPPDVQSDSNSDALLRKLDLPPFFSADTAPKATDIGTATHLFLELCDFAAVKSDADISKQIESLISRKLLPRAQAALIDQSALTWFFTTDLAKTLSGGQSQILREIPFALGYSDAPQPDPADRIMVRGRIDLLLRNQDQSVEVVDYKTDRLTPEQIAQRVETYRTQMEFYREALQKIAGAKVATVHLVFLSARVVQRL